MQKTLSTKQNNFSNAIMFLVLLLILQHSEGIYLNFDILVCSIAVYFLRVMQYFGEPEERSQNTNNE